MFKSIKRAMLSICLAAVFVLGCCVGSGQFVDRQDLLQGLDQALTSCCDLTSARDYLIGFLPDIRERITDMFPKLLEELLEKFL